MSQNVEVPVDLDTRVARSKLKDLEKAKGQAKNKGQSQIWQKVRGKVGMGLGAVAGFRSTSLLGKFSGPADPWKAHETVVEAVIRQHVDKQLGFSARARTRARADTVNQFALSAGLTGSVEQAKQYHATSLKMMTDEENGLNIVRQEIQGPDIVELIEQAILGYRDLIKKSFQYMWDGLTG